MIFLCAACIPHVFSVFQTDELAVGFGKLSVWFGGGELNIDLGFYPGSRAFKRAKESGLTGQNTSQVLLFHSGVRESFWLSAHLSSPWHRHQGQLRLQMIAGLLLRAAWSHPEVRVAANAKTR